jgi:hypothetical protein
MSIKPYMAAHLEETAAKIKVGCSGLSHIEGRAPLVR